MSPEFQKLCALHKPEEVKAGDLWCNKRLGTVKLFLGYKKGRRKPCYTNVHLYSWGEKSLHFATHDLADFDPQGGAGCDILNDHRETWEYCGNIFKMLPYQQLTNHVFKWGFK